MTNSIVRSWDRYQQRPKQSVVDGSVLDDEYVTVGKIVKSEVKRMKNPNQKVSVNFGAVQELVEFGPQTQIEALFAETYRTMKRLGLNLRGVRPFSGRNRFQGGRPSNHDIIRWLDDLEVSDKYARDIQFLQKVHRTLLNRVHSEVIEKTALV